MGEVLAQWGMAWSQWRDGCRVAVQRAMGSRYQGGTKDEFSPREVYLRYLLLKVVVCI